MYSRLVTYSSIPIIIQQRPSRNGCRKETRLPDFTTKPSMFKGGESDWIKYQVRMDATGEKIIQTFNIHPRNCQLCSRKCQTTHSAMPESRLKWGHGPSRSEICPIRQTLDGICLNSTGNMTSTVAKQETMSAFYPH